MHEVSEKIRKYAEETLSRKRYTHSVNVAEEAVRIGRMTGADLEKCYLAGILHDICREYTKEQFEAMGLAEIPGALDPEKGRYDHVLMHGMAAAVVGKTMFGVDDGDILEAVCWHTTGRAGMGVLAQIIFVADYTEPGRKGQHFDIVRAELADNGLLAAVEKEAELSTNYWLGKKVIVAGNLVGLDAAEVAEELPPSCRWSYETMVWAKGELKKEKKMNKENSKKYTEIIVKAMEDRKAKAIEVIDISEKTPITDAFILCSGTSSTHLRGIADEIEEKMKEAGVACAHLEGYDTARWILLDFIDVVVHVFLEEERQFYNIERLWR